MKWLAPAILLSVVLLAPVGDPATQHRAAALAAPTLAHPLGTDALGRDQWALFIHGGRWSWGIGAAATAMALFLAWTLGSLAGWYGGWVDTSLMWLADLFLGIPWLYLLIALRAVLPVNAGLEQTTASVVLAIVLAGWARPARLVRGAVLSERERGWVESARGFGASPLEIYFRHVFPAALELLVTQSLLVTPRFVLAELTLTFAGAGTTAAVPSWGALMVPLKQAYLLRDHWWLALPALAMMPFFVCFTWVARGTVPPKAGFAAKIG